VITELKQLGNTVVLVEHEKSLILNADQVIELGPHAGHAGGELIFQGSPTQLVKDSLSLTGRWLSGNLTLPSVKKRKAKQWLTIKKASLHNVQNLQIKLPLGCFTAFCGVSGSGKSTLAIELIGAALHNRLAGKEESLCEIQGGQDIRRIVFNEKLVLRSSPRSIPATYIGLMTPLRELFAETRLAKARGYTSTRFSLNKKGGRCEACEGLGVNRVKMALMPDLIIPCDVCQGKRYNYETLQVLWENHSFADILNLPAREALALFRPIPALAHILELMNELGLDYLTLGQTFNTLSGGEIQRLRLISDLASRVQETTLYILDEPSAGLHLQDIEKLVKILHRLVDKGHSVFVIEHHLELLRQADWLVELGPGGGPKGGKVIFEGLSKDLHNADTPTGHALKTL
jgi:excinuclease ABC subunit A